MKNTLLSFLALLLCLSFTQCKSKEDKANELIKDYMFKNLYDFDSYQPIETKIDSAFHTIYNDSSAIHYAFAILISEEKHAELKSDYEMLQSSIDIWCDGSYYSSYSSNKCQECLDKAKHNLTEQFFWLSRMDNYRDSLFVLSENLNKEFVGWQVTHDFRCKTKGGNPDIGHYIFTMDKDLKTILSMQDTKDKDTEKVASIIKETLEMTDEERAEIKEILKNSTLNKGI